MPELESLRVIAEQEVRITVGGCELRAHAWDGGSSQRVLLLHGLGGNSITWHAVAPLLAAALKAKVIAPDLPGFGATRPGPERLSYERLVSIVRDLAHGTVREPELAAALVPTPWIVGGNSLGGMLALELARQVPASVGSVTLAAGALPLLWGRTPRHLGALLRFVPALLPGIGRRLVQRYVRRTGLPGVVDDPIRALFVDPRALSAELRQRLLAVSEYRMGWAAEAARAYEQVFQSLSLELLLPGRAERAILSARCPVQVIYGSHDPLFPDAAWWRLRQLRPDWHYVQLRRVGHVPQLEAPELFAKHMLRWLSGVLEPAEGQPPISKRSPRASGSAFE